MSQVEQPADLEVVGELLQVLGEMLDRQARARRVGVNGGRCDGQDARAFPPAHDAIVVLTTTQRSDPLEVDDREEVFPPQTVIPLDQRPYFLEDFVAPVRLAFALEHHGFHDRLRDDRE